MTRPPETTSTRAPRRGFAMLETILSVAAISSIATSSVIYASHAAESGVTKDIRSSFGIVRSELESKWSSRQPFQTGDLIKKGTFKDLPGFVYLANGRVGHKWSSAEVSIENIGGGTVRFEIRGTNAARCKKIAYALSNMAKIEGFQSLLLVNDRVMAGTEPGNMDETIAACSDTEFTNTVGMFMGGKAAEYAGAAGYQMIGWEKTPRPPASPGTGGSTPIPPDLVASNGGTQTPTPPVAPPAPTTPTTPSAPADPDPTGDVAADTGQNPDTPAIPDTPVDPTGPGTPGTPSDPATPTDPVDPADPATPVVPTTPETPVSPTPPSTTPPVVDPVTPVTPTKPGNGNAGGNNPNGNNGHGNDADGNDDSNPGKSNDPNDFTDDDGVPGKSGENGNGNPPIGPEDTPYGHAKTYVTIMMDQFDDKGSARKDKIAALNTWISTLKDGGEDVDFTVIFYDSSAAKSSGTGSAVTNADTFNGGNFGASGALSFADAASQGLGGTVGDGERSVVAIQADGNIAISAADNAAIKAMIAAREASGWKFNFMGGSTATQQASALGISGDYTVSYGPGGLGQAFGDAAAGTTDYAAGKTESFVPGGAR